MVTQCQFEMVISCPEYRNIVIGIKLIVKAYETVVFTYWGYSSFL